MSKRQAGEIEITEGMAYAGGLALASLCDAEYGHLPSSVAEGDAKQVFLAMMEVYCRKEPCSVLGHIAQVEEDLREGRPLGI